MFRLYLHTVAIVIVFAFLSGVSPIRAEQRCQNGSHSQGRCSVPPSPSEANSEERASDIREQPSDFTSNIANDIQHGPGRSNDLVGCDGAVSRLFGGHC
jgi:hypothetical protein